MNFGEALQALKEGKKVSRSGWNANKRPPLIKDFPKIEFDGRIYYDENTELGYILSSKGRLACFSGCDWGLVSSQMYWTDDELGGLFFSSYSDGKKTITLHGLIMGNVPNGYMIDHISGNRLDNRRENLRIVTAQQNIANSKSRDNSSSIYKGVSFDSSRGKWISSIQINKKTKHLGRFDKEEDAAKEYDLAAWKQYGEFAKLNFKDLELPPRMFLVQAGGYSVPLDKLRDGTHFTKEFLESEGCIEFKIVPHIDMWAADKTYVTGWNPSQPDMFADDWLIVE